MKPNWITVDKTSGTGGGTVTIVAEENTSPIVKQTELMFTTSKGTEKKITINQSKPRIIQVKYDLTLRNVTSEVKGPTGMYLVFNLATGEQYTIIETTSIPQLSSGESYQLKGSGFFVKNNRTSFFNYRFSRLGGSQVTIQGFFKVGEYIKRFVSLNDSTWGDLSMPDSTDMMNITGTIEYTSVAGTYKLEE